MYVFPELYNYSPINSLPQQECDKLKKAAIAGDIDVIFKMISDGVDINAPVTEVHSCSQLLHVYSYVWLWSLWQHNDYYNETVYQIRRIHTIHTQL